MTNHNETDLNLDLDILDGFDPEEKQWDALVEAAIAGNVIPVVGPGVLCDDPGADPVSQKLIEKFEATFRLSQKHKTFSQLMFDSELPTNMKKVNPAFKVDSIYGMVSNAMRNTANLDRYFRPSETLRRLVNIKLFPFVITTSYSPVVETAMREAWGDRRVKVLKFSHNPVDDLTPGRGEIVSEEDFRQPTIYYMFGKADTVGKNFVLTDTDMLEFCKSWLSDQTRPNTLCNLLQDKYLLMLGCGYSDWLFRFIWFCMNKTRDTKTTGLMARDPDTHETLVEYLRRIDTFMPDNKTPQEIVAELERRLEDYDESHAGAVFARPPRGGVDVFISYSRTDGPVAEALYKYLTDNGLRVWYDRNDLLGGHRFMDEIRQAIASAKVFVPLITRSIEREAMDAHVYRKEWQWAIDLQETMGARTFIIPVHEDGLDIYKADIPAIIKDLNSIPYAPDMDFGAALRSVTEAIRRLDTFKKSVL